MASIQISTFDEKVIATINTRHLDKDVLVKRVLKAVEQGDLGRR